MRSDHGQDYQGTPGQHIVAIGRARVDAVKQDPGGFGIAIYYTLLDGPSKGQQIYVGHAQPTVSAGQVVKAGQPVATLLKSGLGDAAGLAGWTEIGLARDGAPQFAKPNGGPPLQRLLRGASAAQNGSYTAPPADASQPAANGSGFAATTPAAASAPQDLTVTPPTAAPPPSALGTPGPDVELPGSVNYTFNPHADVASLWQQASQGNVVSPDTLQMLSNAQLSAGV